MVVFFFWFMFIWMFIAIFADIFRRNDISGGVKAGWIILICHPAVPGHPDLHDRPAEDDRAGPADDDGGAGATASPQGYSAADEVAKLAKLRDEGKITAEEYETMKQRAMA